jgi:hypothetical protein
MPGFKREDVDTLIQISTTAASRELRDAAEQLHKSFSVVISGLEMAGWGPDEDNLKHPQGHAAALPPEGKLEDDADKFVKALRSDPEYSTSSFQCVGDFASCRASKQFYVAWCVAVLLVCLAKKG